MSTDKTLAGVQPGGRVRLATVPYDRARDLIGDAYNAGTHGIGYSQQAMKLHDAIIPVQPTPGGQDALKALDDLAAFCSDDTETVERHVAVIRAALAARQPVGEPVALVVPGAPTRCRHCESTDLEWFAHVRAVNDVPHGRLTTHDVGCVFVLGCNECSETLHTVKADSIAALLAAPPAQAVDLEELRRAVCVVGVVGQIDGHDVVRRNSVLDVIDTRRQRLADSQAVGE